ncbi:MAG: flavodoxin family protein [Methanomicrobiales archaeon]|nr:flavodoxin family protein [Methanomicrobiales archaeon]
MTGSATLEKIHAWEPGGEPLSVLGIQGSPRGTKSRTRMLTQWVLAGAADAGAKTELIDLTDLRIEACTACESCSLTGRCVFSDDFPLLHERLIRADGIVLGSPVYIDNVTGQMKIFIDRLADAIHYQVLTGTYGCSVATTWSSGGREVVRYLDHVLNYLGVLTVPGLHVALKNDERAIYRSADAAKALGKELVQAIRTRTKFSEQEAFIGENREFFGRIVTDNREWRPEAYDEWMRRGWIR